MYEVIEGFVGKTIDESLAIYREIKGPFATTGKGLVANTNYSFSGTSAADCVQDGKNFDDAHTLALGGDHLKELAAKVLMETFHVSLTGIAKQANLEHGGNQLVLETTGIPLALGTNGVGEMDKAVINHIDEVDGVEGTARYNIVTSKKFCHGTYTQIQDVLPLGVFGPIREFHTQLKHIFDLAEFTRGVDTRTRVCYDGTDKVKKWSDWKPYMGR